MATPSMSMNMVIHAAVRRDFARLVEALGRPDATDPGRARALGRAYTHLHGELHRHHRAEETIVLPMLRSMGVPEQVCAHVESEHADMVAALGEADAAVADYVRSPEDGTRVAVREAIRTAAEVTTTHLDHEEAELEPITHDLHGTPEWTAVEKELRKGPAREAGDFIAWLTDGASAPVREALDSQVPRPVQFVFGRLLGYRYRSQVAPVWR